MFFVRGMLSDPSRPSSISAFMPPRRSGTFGIVMCNVLPFPSICSRIVLGPAIWFKRKDTELERLFSFYRGFWPAPSPQEEDSYPLVPEAVEGLDEGEGEEEETEEHDACVEPDDEDDGIDALTDDDLAVKLGARPLADQSSSQKPEVHQAPAPCLKPESKPPLPDRVAPQGEGCRLQAGKVYRPDDALLDRAERQARIALLKHLELFNIIQH